MKVLQKFSIKCEMSNYPNISQFTQKVKDAISRNSTEMRISTREANMVIYEINELLLKKVLDKDEVLEIFNDILEKIHNNDNSRSIVGGGFPEVKN